MFNDGFYPSTPEVIELMIAPFVFDSRRDYYTEKRVLRGVKRILEPSAGKGDIADYLCEKFGFKPSNISCCEIEEELVMILQGKGYPVIEKDFLRLAEPYQFDLILMNPPFGNAAEHILKAWDILKIFGGEIISQVNVETIDNPYDFNRQHLARLISMHGSVERIGQPYKDAQRKSNVEVAIVRLKRAAQTSGTKFGSAEDYEQDEDQGAAEFSRNEIASANMLEATVASYNAARQVIVDKSELDGKYFFYTKAIGERPIGTPEEIEGKQREADRSERENRAAKLNKDLSELKIKFWRYLFRRTKIADISTSKVQAEFEKWVASTEKLSFTADNVKHVFTMLAAQRSQIRSDCITQVFDKLCSYDGENIDHREGWVTNDNYRVNRKVIIPIRAANYDGDWATYWHHAEQVISDDIDKAMCFVTNKDFTKIETIERAVLRVTNNTRGRNRPADAWDGCGPAPAIYSEFFKIKIFKKGTIHLTFLDEAVWEAFNIAAAEGKNWIGAQTQHKSNKTQAQHRRTVNREKAAAFRR